MGFSAPITGAFWLWWFVNRVPRATYVSASSRVLINGRPSDSFQLLRSVRQGCPLSPLLFLIAIDALSVLINQEVLVGRIEGVRIPEIDLHLAHNLFADDLTLLIQAELLYIRRCHSLNTPLGWHRDCTVTGTRPWLLSSPVNPCLLNSRTLDGDGKIQIVLRNSLAFISLNRSPNPK